jgi:hypothetical protein
VNCNTFHDRLQQCLDSRRRPEADADLVQHAEHCSLCRERLEVWHRVAELMLSCDHPESSSTGGGKRTARHFGAVAAAAACLVMLFSTFVRDRQLPTASPALDAVSKSDRFEGTTEFIASIDLEGDPAKWWHRVQRSDWVGGTMPTVRTVQEGVAPLGRTLMRAVTILTLGAREQTS